MFRYGYFLMLINLTAFCATDGWDINHCRDISDGYSHEAVKFAIYLKDGNRPEKFKLADESAERAIKSLEERHYEARKNPDLTLPHNIYRFESKHLMNKSAVLNTLRLAYEHPDWELTEFRSELYDLCMGYKK